HFGTNLCISNFSIGADKCKADGGDPGRSTLEPLDWSEINLTERRITVPGYKGKDQKRYHVTILDNLLAWLTPHAKANGSLLPPSQSQNSIGNPSIWRMRRLEPEVGNEPESMCQTMPVGTASFPTMWPIARAWIRLPRKPITEACANNSF